MTLETRAKFQKLLQLVPLHLVLVYDGGGDGGLLKALIDVDGQWDPEDAIMTVGSGELFRYCERDDGEIGSATGGPISNTNSLGEVDGIVTCMPFGEFVNLGLATGLG
jgi:hypothetical protein